MQTNLQSSASRFLARFLERVKSPFRRVRAALRWRFSRCQTQTFALTPRFSSGRRILLIDDRFPHRWMGSGLPRTAELLQALLDLNCSVTFFPVSEDSEAPKPACVDPRVEVTCGRGPADLNDLLRVRKNYYDLCIVSRPHNLARLRAILAWRLPVWGRTRLVYDAEAIYSLRDIAAERLRGSSISSKEEQRAISRELKLASGCRSVICVSEMEAALFRKRRRLRRRVYVLKHTVQIDRESPAFRDRAGFLFVGTLQEGSTPNVDSISWFTREIFPLIRNRAPEIASFLIAGWNPARIDFSACAGVKHVGKVEELSFTYRQARVFVAPTRFAAGVPLKVYEAAAAGIPVVTTSLLARQLGWQPDEELLVADTAEAFSDNCIRLHADERLWNRVREKAMRRVADECSPDRFRATVRQIIHDNIREKSVAHVNSRVMRQLSKP